MLIKKHMLNKLGVIALTTATLAGGALPIISHAEETNSVEITSADKQTLFLDISSFSDEDIVNIKSELQNYGVTEETSQKLVEKLEQGIPLDSMLYDESQAIDVKKIPTLTGYNSIYTFKDGSIIISSTEELETILSNVNLQKGVGISGGSTSSGSGYFNGTNRKVYYSNPGVWEISFKANYSLVQGGYDTISWVGNHNVTMLMGTVGSPSCRIMRSKETATQKAEARLSVYLYIGGSYGTQTRSVSLLVGGDSATARGNNYY